GGNGERRYDAWQRGDRPSRGQVDDRQGAEGAVHDVELDLHVYIGRADVDPIAFRDVADERFAAFDERGEEAPFDRPGRLLGDAIEGLRLEDIDAGVDCVARNLVRLGLLEEPLDVAVAIGFDEAVGAGILDRRQDDRRFGF